MRRSDRELGEDSILSILNKAEGVTVCFPPESPTDKMYAIPMNFGFKNETLYFHSAKDGRKMKAMAKSKNGIEVAVSLFHPDSKVKIAKNPKDACAWGFSYASVIGNGVATLVNDEQEALEGLREIMKQYSKGMNQDFEFKKMGPTQVWKVTLNSISGKGNF